jgi:hypothetical protein
MIGLDAVRKMADLNRGRIGVQEESQAS